MAKEKEEEETGFRVTDKRIFREDGSVRESPAAAKSEESDQARVAGAGPEPPPGTPFRIDFPSYILSYYSQGLMLLGEVPNPMTQKAEQDLEAVRHTIDILALLEEKTRGNLKEEEKALLESVLYELRMKFMAKTDRIKL